MQMLSAEIGFDRPAEEGSKEAEAEESVAQGQATQATSMGAAIKDFLTTPQVMLHAHMQIFKQLAHAHICWHSHKRTHLWAPFRALPSCSHVDFKVTCLSTCKSGDVQRCWIKEMLTNHQVMLQKDANTTMVTFDAEVPMCMYG